MQDTSNNVTIKTLDKVAFRLRKVYIKRAAAIDQIKLVYDDHTEFSIGQDGGRSDTRPVILMEDEFINEVVHERFINYRSAAAAVSFRTNRGRLFEYKPEELTTNLEKEITKAKVDPGYELSSLDIRKGVLFGITQQPVKKGLEGKQFPAKVYAIVNRKMKDDEQTQVKEYGSWHEASADWSNISKQCKLGQAAMLVDVNERRILKKAGKCKESLEKVEKYIYEKGLSSKKDEFKVNMLEGLAVLFKIINTKEDMATFGIVLLFLLLNGIFETENTLIKGNLLNVLGQKNVNNTTETVEATSSLVKFVCNHALNCSDNQHYLVVLLISFSFATLIERLMDAINIWIHHNSCEKRNERMKVLCLQQALSLDMSFYDVHNMHEVRSGMKCHSVNNQLTWNLPYLIQRLCKFVFIAVYIVRINFEVGLILIGGILLFRYFIEERLRRRNRIARRERSKVEWMSDQIFDDALRMLHTIKMFSKERKHIKDFEENQRKKETMISTIVYNRVTTEIVRGTFHTFLFCFALWRLIIVGTNIPGGDLAALFFLLSSFKDNLHSIEFHYNFFKREYPYIDKFIRFHKNKSNVPNGKLKPLKISDESNSQAEIRFNNVSFTYPKRPGQRVIQNLSHVFKPGKMTAIVGHSGNGKSTIAKLLMRLYDPEDGAISINGHNISDIDLEHLHDYISVVPQNPSLFDTTLADNIGYSCTGDKNYEMNDVIEASKRAQCHDFITKFRSGYETFAGNAGNQLSDGQKQRIAIARAAMRKESRILILDEATSSLDAENEELIQKALENLMRDKTIIVIAHRLSTIKNADEVICIKDGNIAEKGTHDSLMRDHGIYYKLIQAQLALPVPEEEEKS